MSTICVLTCNLCRQRVQMDTPPPNTTEPFMCSGCTRRLRAMRAQLWKRTDCPACVRDDRNRRVGAEMECPGHPASAAADLHFFTDKFSHDSLGPGWNAQQGDFRPRCAEPQCEHQLEWLSTVSDVIVYTELRNEGGRIDDEGWSVVETSTWDLHRKVTVCGGCGRVADQRDEWIQR